MLKAKGKVVSLLTACLTMLFALVLGFASLFAPTPVTTANAADTEITFALGEDGTASHSDGSSKTSYGETVDGYTLSLTGGTNMYTGARDAKGNSCIKLGTSSKTGSFSFTVPDDVTSVIISVAGYKAKTVTVTANGASTAITTTSDNAAYTDITVDTSSEKTVAFATSTNYRAMVNTITYVIESTGTEPDPEPSCTHENQTTTTVDETCTVAGSTTVTCDDCGEVISTTEIPATGHDYDEGTVALEATCTTAGSKTVTCNTCQDETTQEIPATGHDYVDGVCSVCQTNQPTKTTETLAIAATTGTLASDSLSISWEGDAFTVINEKYNSSTAIRTSDSDHFRVYKSNKTTISLKESVGDYIITKIVITCTANNYATACAQSLQTDDGTATADGVEVTVSFEKGVKTIEFLATDQWRLSKIEVSYEKNCLHANTTTETINATCTVAGSITETCDDCGNVFTTEIPATGHNLDAGVITTEPQVGAAGEKTYTCQNANCDYTEIESIPALDAETYTVSYSVPNGIDAVPDSEAVVSGETVVLPTAKSKLGYDFVGWVTSELLEDTTLCPEIFAAESEYEVTKNVTLYALYTYSTGSGNYVKVTEAPADWSGEYLIVYENGTNAYVFNGVDAANGYVSATIENSTIEASEALKAETVIIAAMEGGYSILTKNGYIYGTSGSNALGFDTITTQLNTLSLTDGNVDIVSNTSHLRFNSASNQMRFRYYKADSYSAQKSICLYALDSVTYYATNIDLSTNITGANATVTADITMNYYVELSDSFVDNTTMQFIVGASTYDVEPEADGERYKFSLPNLPPHYMTEMITANLICNGEIVDTKENYSIKIYVQNLLNDNQADTELVDFLTAMLHYGAAAQKHQDSEIADEALATYNVLGMADESTAVPDETHKKSLTTHTTDCTAWFEGANVWFSSVNKLCVRINTTENVTLEINGVAVAVTGTTVYTEGILATEFGTPVEFKLYQNGVLMQTLKYGIYSYAYSKQDSEQMGELALALYRYGEAAVAYNT